MARTRLSRPIATAIDHGLLTTRRSVFDYGCGRGGDLRRLAEAGYTVSGWDPAYASTAPKRKAEFVNLGFVVNVIEDPATGSASAALSAYLVSLLPETDINQHLTIEQGVEMGRRSIIELDVVKKAGTVTDVTISGGCVPVMKGEILLQD